MCFPEVMRADVSPRSVLSSYPEAGGSEVPPGGSSTLSTRWGVFLLNGTHERGAQGRTERLMMEGILGTAREETEESGTRAAMLCCHGAP